MTIKASDRGSVLGDLRQSGSMRVLFPRADTVPVAMLLNTAGGVTGGDRFDTTVTALDRASVTVTTQAAERAYAAQPGSRGRVSNTLDVRSGARINWLPQETIMFENCALERRLQVSLEDDAEALIAEPLVFGRPAHGEVLGNALLRDRVSITRNAKTIYADGIGLSGDIHRALQRTTIGQGAGAMATLIFASPMAESMFEPLRELCEPVMAGVSLVQTDLLVCRVLAPDSFELRLSLLPILDHMTGHALPICWRL